MRKAAERPAIPAPGGSDTGGRRTVRSFVLRGRTTEAQEHALTTHWETYGLEPEAGEPLGLLAPPTSPTIMEIGIGNGEALVAMASEDPESLYLGVEVHRPGLGSALIDIKTRGLDNVRLLCHDACDLLAHHVPAGSLAGVRLYFPDPWPKTRHHKRRIVQHDFVSHVARALAPGGLFHLATDWQPYAEHMAAVIEPSPELQNLAGPGQPSPRPAWRPETRFEKRGLKLGHQVTDLIYQRR
ncbi:MAG: tRNA (guanosine(46)-N7)-methyltransferase TrmB [Pseudomonadota bacterium]